MARKYAQIKSDIWVNDDFLDLTMTEQWVYLHIATHGKLTYCGTLDWRPKRIPPMAHGLTLGEVNDAAEVLRAKRYIIIDDDTEEVLVRSFLRNDGLLKQKNMGGAVANAYKDIGSRELKGVIVHELKRLHKENPEWKSWEYLNEHLNMRSVNPWDGIEPQTVKLPETTTPLPIGFPIVEDIEEPPF